MGSIGSPNSWAQYNSYKDCSRGICSIYCPQWCYIVFPPPPSFSNDDNPTTNFSPVIIAVIGILSSALLVIAYFTLFSKYCRMRRSSNSGDHQNPNSESESLSTNLSQIHHDQLQGPATSTTGLDQSFIESITVYRYRKGDGFVEDTDCAVCLSEFEENEKIRVLPKCNHAFHLPCIDMWLKSHSNCPLCRANVVYEDRPLPQSDPIVRSSSNFYVSSLRVQSGRDLIVVVEDPEMGYRTESVVENGSGKLRRTFPCGDNLLVSNILQISEDDEEIEMGIVQLPIEIGSSRGIPAENSMEVETSISSCLRHEKGKNSVVPNS